MTSFRRLSLACALVAVLAVGACGSKSGGTSAATAPSGLSDQGYSIGNANAKVTVVEYGSLTCPHCARWEEEVWPAFKAKYVDTGKVHYVFREVPDPSGASTPPAPFWPAASAADKYFATVQAIFRTQPQMFGTAAQPGDMRGALLNVAKAEGMSEAQFQACLSDTKGLTGGRRRARRSSTTPRSAPRPTFVINGKVYDCGRDADRQDVRSRRPARSRARPVRGRSPCNSSAFAFRASSPSSNRPSSDRARPDRRGRAERLRQVEPAGGAALGHGRQLRQGHAGRRHGRRDLRRGRRASRPQPRRGAAAHRQHRPHRPGPLQRRTRPSRWCAASTGARARPTASTARRCGRATCSFCSPTPPPAPTPRPWCARGRSPS